LYDEVRETVHSITPSQCPTKLQEGKQLLVQVEAARKKEALLKARLEPWLEESYQIMTTIQDKLKSLQQMHHTMRLVAEGPTTEKLVEEVKQASTQSDAEVAID